MIKCESLSLRQCSWLDLNILRGSTILITGGTGLVGYNILKALADVREDLDLHILALVRNVKRAEERFADFVDGIELVEGDVTSKTQIDHSIDYIIHGASITSSKAFVEQPVETILTSIDGLRNMLELSLQKKVKSMVYLSSMEAYGSPTEDVLLTEQDVGYLDPLQVRSSYPEGKRLCENLCVAYAKEYGIDVKIARLAQTFGAGMQKSDKRAVVQFVQSALDGKEIAIKASGESARMYLHTFDAASALLTLLLNGEKGQAYNVANKDTYCSIRVLAQTICDLFNPDSRVLVNTGTAEERAIYPPDSFLRLDTSKLEKLGWRPFVSLEDSLKNLAEAVRER